MAAQAFRTAFNGFNREDVVQYIEYLKTKHTSAINQLKGENQELSEELEALRGKADAAEECAQLRGQNDALQVKCQDLEAEIEALKQQLAEAQQAAPLADEELEAYRRAEKAERTARERARQIYCQATGALSDATTQVDEAAEHFKLLSQRISSQLSELQTTVERSKDALAGAAATMYAIRPTESDNT